MTPETCAVLLRAAELIEREGWVRGALENALGRCCVGAIRTAAGWPRITPQAEDYFLRHVDSLVPPARKTGRCPIAVWNDHICPDAATAVRELRACAGVQP